MIDHELLPTLPARKQDAHKGDFGRILIIAGSRGMSGAAALAGRAALRSGAGLVTVATPLSSHPIVAGLEPCYTTLALPEDTQGRISIAALDGLLKTADLFDCIVLGPGLGQSPNLREITRHLIMQENLYLIVDADGLNNLSHIRHWPRLKLAQLTLTPHPGEMQRLYRGLFRQPVPEDRQDLAETFARETNTIVVLKGDGTVISDGARTAVNITGNPGMATAGSGDVLAGIIAALNGQGLNPWDAARLGVHVHGLAGDLGVLQQGMISLIASDLINHLGAAFCALTTP